MKATVEAAGITHRGRVRDENQDAWLSRPDHGVFVVADGVGGMQGGAAASQAVTRGIDRALDDLASPTALHSLDAKAEYLCHRLERINRWIKETETGHKRFAPRSTFTILVLSENEPSHAEVLHLGDSMVYRYQDGVEKALIQPHNLAAAGVEESKHHHIITRALGMDIRLNPEITRIEREPSDRFLLCTDGIYRMLTPKERAHIVASDNRPDILCQTLLHRALQAGGSDNLAAVVVHPMG